MRGEHEVYVSPFSWRYGSDEMRQLWSEAHRRRLMRRVWLALAEAQSQAGLVTEAQVDDLRRSVDDIDIDRASEIEATTQHDVMAELKVWVEQASVGGAVLHLGATSADITDNVDALRIRDGLDLLRDRLLEAIDELAVRVLELADSPTLGWTHIQPASPTTVGYRLAGTLADLLTDLGHLEATLEEVKGKGFKGAVGTAASYVALLEGRGTSAAELEADAMRRLGLPAVEIASQVYPRKTDYTVLTALAGIAASASSFAANLRILQSPPFGEWSETFGRGQVGSTAMPWKRNPINAENVNSLARYVASLPVVAWQNEACNLLERTLDDSANRRVVLPEAFLATDEVLQRLARLFRTLQVDERATARTLAQLGPFAAIERVLMAAASAGADRQKMHERLRVLSMEAWTAVEKGEDNPLSELVSADEELARYVAPDLSRHLLTEPEAHVGDAAKRARAVARRAQEEVASRN